MPEEQQETLDTSDVDRYVGQAVDGGQLKEPITVTDIRRWVQAMDYPNPIHFEEQSAARTPTGVIVASQSFLPCCDVSHGTLPAITGRITNSHVVFGGDEFWFYGARVRPGDLLRSERKFVGYKLGSTKFAGPTMFSRGDTLYVNQRKETVGKQRCTMVRYLPEHARRRGYYDQLASSNPSFTAERLREFAARRRDWIRSGESGGGPGSVKVGDKLPMRPMGPHTVATFTTEFRAFLYGVWGGHYYEGQYLALDAGWLPELLGDSSDPGARVGMEEGPGSGHTSLSKAKLIGMPRHYGYGTSMGVWALDYVGYWAGDCGFIRHAKIDYRFPVFEGDVTFINGEVTGLRFDPLLGVQMASLQVTMTNQDGATTAQGPVEVELARI